MENIILSCRQVDSKRVYGNGDYRTTLAEPIQLFNGDQLILNKVFVDNRELNQTKFVLDEDLELTFSYYYYWTNWLKNEEAIQNENLLYKIKTFQTTELPPVKDKLYRVLDAQPYIANQRIEYPSNGNPQIVYSGEFNIKRLNYGVGFGKLTVQLNWKDIPGNENSEDVVMNIQQRPVGTTLSFAIRQIYTFDPTSFQLSNKSLNDLNNLGWEFDGFVTANFENKAYVFKPIEASITITIPSGTYFPQELSDKISQLMTDFQFPIQLNETTGTNVLTTSKILVDTYGKNEDEHGDKTGEDIVYLPLAITPLQVEGVNTDNNIGFYFRQMVDASKPFPFPYIYPNIFVGTSQFSFNYDTNINKFSIDYMHMPIYSEQGSIIIKMKKDELDDNLVECGGQSGIILSSVPSFLIDRMGFSPDITPTINYIQASPGLPTGDIFFYPVINPKFGTHITKGYVGIDGLINKVNSKDTFYIYDITDGQEDSSDETTVIYAQTEINPASLDDAYIVVELDTNFKQTYIGEEDTKRSINAIVSQYYTAGGYTSGNSSDAYVYQHFGAPIYLSSVGVRLLDPTFKTIQDLGEDNTVILQVSRNRIPPQLQNNGDEKERKK